MLAPSSDTRVSMTAVSSDLQYGHFSAVQAALSAAAPAGAAAG
jgi:hypothetical protein